MINPRRVIVMGVAGSGKTTVGHLLADRLGVRFLDADSVHPPLNVAKMADGEPLTDADRWPWLALLRKELRSSDEIVLACSALKRSYRDVLRHAGNVHFVFLDLEAETAHSRASGREGHYMSAAMVASQFAALERPDAEETDVMTVDAIASVADLVDQALLGLATADSGPSATPLLAVGGVDREISDVELTERIEQITRDHVLAAGATRVLLVPPDHTRLHSRSGPIAMMLKQELEHHGCTVGVLPALGTHVEMTNDDTAMMFGTGIDAAELFVHEWRAGLRVLGEISAEEVAIVTDGLYAEPIPVAIDAQLFDGWDLVISIGQVVPHEVIGMANFTKNLVIGLGGAPTIHRSHFVGAVAGMEQIMGRASSAVRDVVDAAFDRFVAPLVPVLWILTVIEDVDGTMVQRGLYVGAGGTMSSGGAAFRAAAALAQQSNIEIVLEPLARVVCWLDPAEMRSTWLGNKAVYRTRMAIADGGELVILAPGVERFGEDDVIDRLIRRHGYRGTPATLDAVRTDAELAANLGAAAHLIHGSSEGRFRVVWCTDPDAGGLTRDEIEAVGYEWRPFPDEVERTGIDLDTTSGHRLDSRGEDFYFVGNPAMGLWSTAANLID